MMDDDELSHDARTLLARAQGGDDPTAADRNRIRRVVLASVGAGAGLAASSAASSAAASSAVATTSIAGLSVTAKIAAVVLVVGVVGGGTLAVAPWESDAPAPVHHRAPVHHVVVEEEALPQPQAPARIEAIAPAIEEPAPPVVEIAPPPRAPRAIRTIEPPQPERSPNTIGAELALLRSAQAAMNANDPETALARLSEHARLYPNGGMVEEREAARILALCRAGRRDEARAAAARFLHDRPSSPLAPRVRASCD